MGKTLAQVITQVRELVGDYQATTFTDESITEAITFGMNVIMRQKGFNNRAMLFKLGGYPTGTLPDELLVVKRVQLVSGHPPT